MPCHHFPWLHQERGYNIMVRPKKNRSNEREIKTNFVLKFLIICMNFSKLGGTSAIEVNFMAFGLHKFSRA